MRLVIAMVCVLQMMAGLAAVLLLSAYAAVELLRIDQRKFAPKVSPDDLAWAGLLCFAVFLACAVGRVGL
jgi:hypothetical protein